MPYIPPEVVAQAREMDLLTYLRNYEPHELVHFGGNTYCTREHDSLKISNGKWYWFSRGIGGYTERTEEKHMISARHRVIAFINLFFMVMFPFKISCCFQMVRNLGMKKARGDPWHGSGYDSFFTFLSVGMD